MSDAAPGAHLTILEAMDLLWGPLFAGESWRPWRTFLASLFGLKMTTQQRALFTTCTGRQTPPTKAFAEAVLVCGRRAGKSRILALIATFLALFGDWQSHLAPGEVATIAAIATDRRQARILVRYISGLLRSVQVLADQIGQETGWSISIPSRRVVIEIHTASLSVTRGYTLAAVLADESAFWPSDDHVNPDTEIIRALRPGLLSLRPAGSMLLIASSPYSRRGLLWESFRRHYGRDDAPVLVWKASTMTMNSTLDPDEILAAYEEDPDGSKSEYGAEFRDDINQLLDRATIEAAVIPGRRELPRVGRVGYKAFTDPSGGSSDSFCLSIAHAEDRDGVRIGVQDVLREFRPPFNADNVCAEFAKTLADYGLHSVTGDRYGGEWPAQRFETYGVKYEPAEKSKSDLYLAALPLLNSRRVELLDNPRLVAQLASLERRTGRGTGRDVIDSPIHQHDDLANVTAAVLSMVAGERNFIDVWTALVRPAF